MKKLLVIFAILVMLAACGGGGGDGGDELIGTWETVGVIEGETLTADILADGRYIWYGPAIPIMGEWEIKGGRFCETWSDGSGLCYFYKIEGDYLTLARSTSGLENGDDIWKRVE